MAAADNRYRKSILFIYLRPKQATCPQTVELHAAALLLSDTNLRHRNRSEVKFLPLHTFAVFPTWLYLSKVIHKGLLGSVEEVREEWLVMSLEIDSSKQKFEITFGRNRAEAYITPIKFYARQSETGTEDKEMVVDSRCPQNSRKCATSSFSTTLEDRKNA
jgi:hypothetical protein